MKIIVTGAKGQLGYDVVKYFQSQNDEVIGIDIDNLDITNEDMVYNFINTKKPDVIVHCAAFTSVDDAEEKYETAYKINVLGTKYLTQAAINNGSKILYISTDYVFDGKKDEPYETDDQPNPLTAYGKSKYLGELEVMKNPMHFIVRIAWVFGINGKNFIRTMLQLSKVKDEINVVCDQLGSPTYTVDLSKLLYDIVNSNKYGIYHATNEGYTNWAEFAQLIMEVFDKQTRVNPIPTSQYITKARRPLNSRLSKKSLDMNGFKRLPSWRDALVRFKLELLNKGETI